MKIKPYHSEFPRFFTALLLGLSIATTTAADTWEAHRDTSWKTDGVTLTIKTAAQLAQFAYLANNYLFPNDKRIQLVADIDLSAHNWIPINQTSYGVILDGNGRTIKGLHCKDPSLYRVGLFGLLDAEGSPIGDNISDAEYKKLCDDYTKKGVVYNLTIDGAIIEGGKYAGVLAGEISHWSAFSTSISGITIKNSKVTGSGCAGGVAGYLFEAGCKKSIVLNTYVSGKKAGGIAGDSLRSGIFGSTRSANVTEDNSTIAENVTVIGSECAGGVVGGGEFFSYIENSVVSGTIEAPTAGGIAGCFEQSDIVQCMNLAEVHSTGKSAGGMVGTWKAGNSDVISKCCNRGITRVSSKNASDVAYVGGIAGLVTQTENPKITLCMSSGNIYVDSNLISVSAGGLVGCTTGTGSLYLRDCYSRGKIENRGTIGGIVGTSSKDSYNDYCAKPTYCYWWTGTASTSGEVYVQKNHNTLSSFGSAPGVLTERLTGWLYTVAGPSKIDTTDLLKALYLTDNEKDAPFYYDDFVWTLKKSPDGYPMLYVLADTKGGSGWVPNKYTLNLDSQEAGNVERSVTYGSRYGTLPTPTRTGYTFLGWFTNATGGTQVFAGTTVNSECNHTLYAHWLAKTFTVTYDANGGTPAKQIRNATYDLGVADTPDTPRRAGFSFTGWFTAKTGGKKVSDETLATITANQTLYARWEVYVNRYDISLDAQGGWVSTDSVQVSENDAYGALPVPTLPDYAFLGWYADRDCAGEKITAATLVTQSQSHTLYAKWLYAVMPVTFKGNGGYPASQTQTQMYGDRYILPEAPEREGYTFLGWFTDSAATGVPITASARVTETAEFYAKWALAGAVPVAYTIADGPGTITLSPANGQAVKGKAVTLTAKPAKNALFVDWSTGATTASIKVTPEEDTVYVARFRMKEDCAAPVIENIIPPECRMVGVQFDMQVQINDDAKPVKFTATNLPAGLKIDAATGVISGVPTKTGTFDKATVKVTGVANAKQFASITLPQMTIEALPWDAQGVFNGVLADSSSRNLCGSFSITVSATGKITAKIVSIDGTWTISAPSWTKSSSDVFSATIKTDKGQILNLESSTRHDEDLTWMSVNFYSTDAQGNVNGEYFASGVRNQFANSKDESYGAARALISAYTGYYTLDLLPEGIISYEGMGGIYNVPDGGGYLTATIDAKGSAKFSGKLADGTAVSGSSTVFAFRQGTYTCLYIPVSILLYGSKGGIWNAGDFCIGSDGNGRIGAGGRFAWLYPGKVPAGKTPATEDRFHIDILSEGGLYNKAANLADYYAGRTFSTDSCSVVLEADGKGGIKLPKGVDNPGAVTLTLNKTTGLFSGKLNIYNLDDPTAKPISVSHQGVLLQYERIRGRGFYLIPETWKSDDAKPVSYAIKRSYPVGID